MTEYRVVTHQKDGLGEGPLWVVSEQALYWVDMSGHRLHRYSQSDGAVSTWAFPDKLCWIVERSDSTGFLVGLASGIAALTLDPFGLGSLFRLEPELSQHRLNDAKVDPQGRLWAGSMENRAALPTGAFFRIDALGTFARLDVRYLVPNGPAFSPDGQYLYHADSLKRVVYRFRAAPDGTLHDKRSHIVFSDEWGLPDGMTVDSAGHLWIAHWDGGRVSRFDPDGKLDRAIALPASRITSCAFGGPNLDRLFITSSRDEREDEPLAGALFELQPDVGGIAPTAFKG